MGNISQRNRAIPGPSVGVQNVTAQGSPYDDYHQGNRNTQLLSHSTTCRSAVAGSLCFMRLLFFDRRQGRRLFLSAIDSSCSARDPAQRQLTAIVRKKYLPHFVGTIVPALEHSQLVAEALRGWASARHERFQGSADATIERLRWDGFCRCWLRRQDSRILNGLLLVI